MTAEPFFTATNLDELLSTIDAHRTQHANLVKNLGKSAIAVKNAVETVAESFSGSWFGWHAEMYYGNFEKPPMGKLFSIEWGAYHGLPPRWQRRSKADVDGTVEQITGQPLKSLSAQRWQVARGMKELRDDLLARLAPITNIEGLDRERELLQKLDGYDWDEATYDGFLVAARSSAPQGTRDSQAFLQGQKVPAHIECLALAQCCEQFAVDAQEFWALGARLTKQLQAHAAARVALTTHADNALEIVLKICRQFHVVTSELRLRHANRGALQINDEYDVQDLLRALLRQQFDDVRQEEAAPSFAGRSPRLDFLLKKERMVIETKMARDGLRDKEIGDELLQDIARYKSHPDCSTLVCFIYDPHSLVRNPHGLTADLERQSDARLSVRVILCPNRA